MHSQASEQRNIDTPRRHTPGWLTVVRITCGNFLEMFDFFLFGLYAAPIAAAFFPAKSQIASLMGAFVVFGAGFLMRPLGAIVLGAYIDTVGRSKGLVMTLGIMAAGTLLLTLTPGYGTIGMLAPILVVLGRLLQGFSAGVELGGVSVYLAEMASPGHKGFMVAWQSASQQVAIIVAAALGFGINKLLAPADIASWGWRIPFAIGCLLVPFLFYIRRLLEETPDFMARRHQRPTLQTTLQSMQRNWRLILGGMSLVLMTTVSFYLITVYTPAYSTTVMNLSQADSLLVTCCIGLSNFIWLPVIGALSDKIGRRPVLLFYSALAVFSVFPALSWLAAAPDFGRMLAVELWLSFLFGGYNGGLVVALTEVIPKEIRTTGFSLAYSLATSFGGFTAAISTLLIRFTGDKASPGLWMSAAALCAFVTTLVMWRRLDAAPKAVAAMAI